MGNTTGRSRRSTMRARIASHGRLWHAVLLFLAFRHRRIVVPGTTTVGCAAAGFVVVPTSTRRSAHALDRLIRPRRQGIGDAEFDLTSRTRRRSPWSRYPAFLFATVEDHETSTSHATAGSTSSSSPSADVQRLLELVKTSDGEGLRLPEGEALTDNCNYSTFREALEHCHQTSNPALTLQVLRAMKRHPTAHPTDDDYGIVVRTICRSSDATRHLPDALELVESEDGTTRVPLNACLELLRVLRHNWRSAVRVLRAVESRMVATDGFAREDDEAVSTAYRLAIEACAASGQAEPALQILQSSLQHGVTPTPASYGTVISAFAKRLQWRRCLQLLDQMNERGLQPSLATYNSILAAMSKAREAGPALALLGRLRQQQQQQPSATIQPDIYSYNSALAAAAGDPRYWKEALQVFDQCQREPGVTPDVYTYSNAIRACAKGGQTQRALALLQAAKDLRLPVDGYCYTAAMEACSKAKMWGTALDLLKEMQVEYNLKPNAVAFSLCISACGNAGRWQTALDLLQQMRDEGLKINLITYNSAITALSKSASKQRTRAPVKPLWPIVQSLLRQMRQEGLEPDGFSFSSAISCCGAEGRWEEALQLIEEMKSSGTRPNRVAFSAAISTCGKNGQFEHAWRLFQEMRDQGVAPDRVAYNALFSALRVAKRGEDAYELWREMLAGNRSSNATRAVGRGFMATPDIITVTEAIAALASNESQTSKQRVDEVFSEAFDRGIVLRSNLDSAWDFDLSGMSLPVARAACRFILNRIAKSIDSDDVHDLTLITGVGANHVRRSAADQGTSEASESRNISLRDYIQEILTIDFLPPLESIIPSRAQGTLLVTKPVLLKWLSSLR